MRDFIALCEKENDLKRITAEVDWDLEMTHISKLVEEKDGRACLFENVKGHKGSVFFGAYSSTKRLAMALGKPAQLEHDRTQPRVDEDVHRRGHPCQESREMGRFSKM